MFGLLDVFDDIIFSHRNTVNTVYLDHHWQIGCLALSLLNKYNPFIFIMPMCNNL